MLYKIIDAGDEYYVEAEGIALAVETWLNFRDVGKECEPEHVMLLSHEPVIR